MWQKPTFHVIWSNFIRCAVSSISRRRILWRRIWRRILFKSAETYKMIIITHWINFCWEYSSSEYQSDPVSRKGHVHSRCNFQVSSSVMPIPSLQFVENRCRRLSRVFCPRYLVPSDYGGKQARPQFLHYEILRWMSRRVHGSAERST